MHVTIMKSKIHRARVTEANLNYTGSITMDRDLMEAADILPNERVQVVDLNNGNRLETYVIAAERGSGVVCLNGAAARLVLPGDIIIVLSYGIMDKRDAEMFKPKVVFVNSENRVVKVDDGETPGDMQEC